MSRKRSFFAPEVIQTSAMDCGPASLKCLLEGHGTHVSYGRLREACQTDVDGTSIDTIEEVAVRLGLEAEQIIIPADHVVLPEACVLPAVVIVRQPSGMTHFVVVWRRHGPFVQIMDPAQGRRWVRIEQFLADLYVHAMPVSAHAWRAWAESGNFIDPLAARHRRLGLHRDQSSHLIEMALREAGWLAAASLDAATRMVESLVRAGGIRRGRPAGQLLRALLARAAEGGGDDAVPEAYWSVRPAEPSADGDERVMLRGAVVVRVEGVRKVEPGLEAAGDIPLSPELEAALHEAPARPARDLWRLVRADGLLAPAALVAALVAAAAGVLVEALLFRAVFDLGHTLALAEQRLAALGLILAFLIALLFIEWPIFAGALRMGRRLEARMRLAFLAKIPRLDSRYFDSRPVSDMAERSHGIHRLRLLPTLGSGLLRCGFGILLTTAGITWIEPHAALLALAAAGFAIAWPLLTQPLLAERDLRLQTHAGALGRFYLDSLMGLAAVRAHGAERAVRREHEGLLVEWARAGFRLQRALVGVEGVHQLVGLGLAAWLLYSHLNEGEVGTVLLLVYWTLNLPMLGQEFAFHVHQYPSMRNATLRLLEPLGALESIPAADSTRSAQTPKSGDLRHGGPGVTLDLESVRVVAGGHTILDAVDLHVPAGQHVAIVGRSGAGKSSLVGLLLGWHRIAAGRVLVDGAPLDGPRLEALRQETAWVDPAVHLWNTSLLENLYYASEGESAPLGQALEHADLGEILHKMPEGLQTHLGESGARVSGGEGQRVRFGRALLQTGTRLVILDEPFRGLDHEHRRALLSRARRYWPNATLLCITHDVGDTQDFERVLVVEDGCVVEDGHPAEMLQRPSRYRTLIEQERLVRDELWEDEGWRRLRLTRGALTEQPAPPQELEHELKSLDMNGHAFSSHMAGSTAS